MINTQPIPVRISNASTPASIGADVLVPRDGSNGFSRWQFVIINDRLFFATLGACGWGSLSPIERPERFGEYGTTFPTLRAWLVRFFAEDVA